MSLKHQTFSAVRWTALVATLRAGLQLLQIAILARLLAPEDFGLMALVTAILGFMTIFSEMGISSAIIHHQNFSHQQLSSLYWFNVLTGFITMLLLSTLSPFLAIFYQDPRLIPLIILASSNLFTLALSQQLRAKAEKEIRFSILARIEMFSVLLGFISAVIMAYRGLGVFALVGASIISSVITTLLSWKMLSNGWRPEFRLRIGEIKESLHYGAYIIGNNIANNINVMADIFLGGYLLSATALGLYSLPRNLCLQIQFFINPIITRVGFPVMSKLQNDPERLKTVYLKTIRMTASINFPIYISMAFFAPEIITIIFGKKWIESVDILRILAIWGMFRSLLNPVGSLLMAVGKMDLSFKWNLLLLCVIPITLWYGSRYGVLGLAFSLLLITILLLFPAWYFLVKPCCKASIIEYFKQPIIPLSISLITFGLEYYVLVLVENILANFSINFNSSVIIYLTISLSIGAIIYMVISYFLNKEWVSSILQLANRSSRYK